ncbi:hypothetical protein ACTWP5_23535 [Streptomyces sp. 4N509B]|uniref:hypothetical protein n=1 Tax=Streptomyces sp. 4N509B TaxID=3457413 RepID=UPI003FD05C37
MITFTFIASVAVWSVAGIRVATESPGAYVLYPLGGVALWAVVMGPILLTQLRRVRKTKRRLEEAAEAIPAPQDGNSSLPWCSDDDAGRVLYGGDSLRLISKNGGTTTIPFSEIHFTEELPPKGILGIPGIDVLTKAGHWTELRVTDNTGLLTALEQAGTPVVRARNFPFKNKYA